MWARRDSNPRPPQCLQLPAFHLRKGGIWAATLTNAADDVLLFQQQDSETPFPKPGRSASHGDGQPSHSASPEENSPILLPATLPLCFVCSEALPFRQLEKWRGGPCPVALTRRLGPCLWEVRYAADMATSSISPLSTMFSGQRKPGRTRPGDAAVVCGGYAGPRRCHDRGADGASTRTLRHDARLGLVRRLDFPGDEVRAALEALGWPADRRQDGSLWTLGCGDPDAHRHPKGRACSCPGICLVLERPNSDGLGSNDSKGTKHFAPMLLNGPNDTFRLVFGRETRQAE